VLVVEAVMLVLVVLGVVRMAEQMDLHHQHLLTLVEVEEDLET
jgi:hypothetical protein